MPTPGKDSQNARAGTPRKVQRAITTTTTSIVLAKKRILTFLSQLSFLLYAILSGNQRKSDRQSATNR